MNERIRELVLQLIILLVEGSYEAVERKTGGIRLSADQTREAISSYGRTFVRPPPEAFAEIDLIETKSTQNRSWSVQMPLWTVEEGRSDLSLLVTIRLIGTVLTAELDDIHVL